MLTLAARTFTTVPGQPTVATNNPSTDFVKQNYTPYELTAGWCIGGQPCTVIHEKACKVTAMPTIDVPFLDRLRAKGYVYFINYPQDDPGTGKAFLTWSAADGNSGWGSARLSGAGWSNQYAPSDGCMTFHDYVGPNATESNNRFCMPYLAAHGDWAGAVVAALPASERGVAARVVFYGGVPDSLFAGIPTGEPNGIVSYDLSQVPSQYKHKSITVLIDPWLTTTSPPPLPPPPTVAKQGPRDINIGQAGAVAGVGKAVSSAALAEGAAAFDPIAYCSAPARDGKPRSHAWIMGCLNSMGQ